MLPNSPSFRGTPQQRPPLQLNPTLPSLGSPNLIKSTSPYDNVEIIAAQIREHNQQQNAKSIYAVPVPASSLAPRPTPLPNGNSDLMNSQQQQQQPQQTNLNKSAYGDVKTFLHQQEMKQQQPVIESHYASMPENLLDPNHPNNINGNAQTQPTPNPTIPTRSPLKTPSSQNLIGQKPNNTTPNTTPTKPTNIEATKSAQPTTTNGFNKDSLKQRSSSVLHLTPQEKELINKSKTNPTNTPTNPELEKRLRECRMRYFRGLYDILFQIADPQQKLNTAIEFASLLRNGDADFALFLTGSAARKPIISAIIIEFGRILESKKNGTFPSGSQKMNLVEQLQYEFAAELDEIRKEEAEKTSQPTNTNTNTNTNGLGSGVGSTNIPPKPIYSSGVGSGNNSAASIPNSSKDKIPTSQPSKESIPTNSFQNSKSKEQLPTTNNLNSTRTTTPDRQRPTTMLQNSQNRTNTPDRQRTTMVSEKDKEKLLTSLVPRGVIPPGALQEPQYLTTLPDRPEKPQTTNTQSQPEKEKEAAPQPYLSENPYQTSLPERPSPVIQGNTNTNANLQQIPTQIQQQPSEMSPFDPNTIHQMNVAKQPQTTPAAQPQQQQPLNVSDRMKQKSFTVSQAQKQAPRPEIFNLLRNMQPQTNNNAQFLPQQDDYNLILIRDRDKASQYTDIDVNLGEYTDFMLRNERNAEYTDYLVRHDNVNVNNTPPPPDPTNSMTTNPADTLDRIYYCGAIGRTIAEALLIKRSRDGYLVRYSDNAREYVIVKYESGPKRFTHLVLEKTKDGPGYQFQKAPDTAIYSSIRELIIKTPELNGYKAVYAP